MNRFAHSVDEPMRLADLNDTLALTCALSGRFASMQGVTLALEPPSTQVAVITNPFFLQNLIWLCLDFAMGSAGAGKTVVLRAEKTENGAKIHFSKLKDLANRDTDSFPGEREKALLQALKAVLLIHKESGEMLLTLPAQFES